MKLYYSDYSSGTGHEAVYRLLEACFAREYGSALPHVEKTGEGKPFFPDRPDVYFSLSHTRRYVLCALSGRPVGCDIELPRPVSRQLELRVCTVRQLEQFDFFSLWTLKESAIKLLGRMDRDLREFDFVRVGRSIRVPGSAVTCEVFRPGPCVAAVCGFGPGPEKCEYLPV